MSRINLRIREMLFSSLLCQDLPFFQETKTGKAWGAGLGSPCMFLAHLLPPTCTQLGLPASLVPGPGAVFPLFGDLSLCKEGGLREMIGRSGWNFWGFCITTHGFLACSVLPRGAEFPAELGYQTDE